MGYFFLLKFPFMWQFVCLFELLKAAESDHMVKAQIFTVAFVGTKLKFESLKLNILPLGYESSSNTNYCNEENMHFDC